jgi:hypothetical protein
MAEQRRYHRLVSRPGLSAALAALAVLGAACSGGTLDAGRNNPHDGCASDLGGTACGPSLLDGLVGHWRLDDGTGSMVAVDSSGRGNDGTLHGLDVNAAWVAGRSLGALQTAHAGWVQVPMSPSINAIVDAVTVSAWVYQETPIADPDNFGTALSRQIGTSQDQFYHLSLFGGRPTLFITTGAGYVAPGAPDTVPMNTWIHLAGTWDGATARLYVSGSEIANQALTGTIAHDMTPVILGGNGNDASGVPTELFPGRLDELMLFSRALSAYEVAQLAAGAAFPKVGRDAGTD